MKNDSNINLKHILNRLFEARQHIEDIYRSVKMQLGEDANFVREWCDLRRVQYESETEDEFEGDALFEDVLQVCWKTNKDYVWHYHGSKFRVSPFKNGTEDDGGFIFYYGEKHSLITFAGVVRDSIDTDTNVWEVMVARMFGLADGYVSASLKNPDVLKEAVKDGRLTKVLADQPAPDAEPVPDGTLACADHEPVVDQAEKPNRLIRAGGPSGSDTEQSGTPQ